MIDRNLQAYNCIFFSNYEAVKQQMSNEYKHNLVSMNQTGWLVENCTQIIVIFP